MPPAVRAPRRALLLLLVDAVRRRNGRHRRPPSALFNLRRGFSAATPLFRCALEAGGEPCGKATFLKRITSD
jgi:hypothetical protein